MKLKDIKLNERGQVVLALTGARIAFSGNGNNHFEPNEFQGKLRHDCAIILEDKHVKAVEKALDLICDKHNIDLDDLSAKETPLRVGNKNRSAKTGEVYDGFEDKMYLSVIRHAETHKGKKINPPVVKGSDKATLTEASDPRVKQDGAYVNIQVVFYKAGSYDAISCSYDFIVYRNDEFEPFGGGAEIEDEDAMFEGTSEVEEADDDI